MPNPIAGLTRGEPRRLATAVGKYPHTAALLDGRITSSLLRLQFADFPTINRAFAPMLRAERFDVCEMAIASFLQAKAYGKPLVLMPVVLAARFQEPALLCLAESDIRSPRDLAGRRVGVRAYSQTTGVWLRGILADSYNLTPQEISWVTFEDAHVAEYRDPPWTERAPAGANPLGMLRQGELDAVIVGNELPDDPALRSVFADPDAAAAAFLRAQGVMPINHMLIVRGALAAQRPDLLQELLGMFRAAAGAVPAAPGAAAVAWPATQLNSALELAARYCEQQGLLPHAMNIAQIWAGLPVEAWELPEQRPSRG
jgi:4,5-dihydroxyphthalate decarboxylase